MGDPRVEVARGARMLARAGLVHAFGHTSVRTSDEGIAISSTRPLDALEPEDVVVLDADGRAVAGPVEEAPIEIALHRAIYAARPDVGGIARGHPPHVVRWGIGTRDLPLLHGLGALAGLRVPVHTEVDLVASPTAATAAASTLGDGWAMLLRANGAVTVGVTLDEAATRLWFLEDRARVALGAVPVDAPIPSEIWERRAHHVPPELRRAIAWFTTRFGGETEGSTYPEVPRVGDREQRERGDAR